MRIEVLNTMVVFVLRYLFSVNIIGKKLPYIGTTGTVNLTFWHLKIPLYMNLGAWKLRTCITSWLSHLLAALAWAEETAVQVRRCWISWICGKQQTQRWWTEVDISEMWNERDRSWCQINKCCAFELTEEVSSGRLSSIYCILLQNVLTDINT